MVILLSNIDSCINKWYNNYKEHKVQENGINSASCILFAILLPPSLNIERLNNRSYVILYLGCIMSIHKSQDISQTDSLFCFPSLEKTSQHMWQRFHIYGLSKIIVHLSRGIKSIPMASTPHCFTPGYCWTIKKRVPFIDTKNATLFEVAFSVFRDGAY